MKYDFELDMDSDNSLSIIIKQINPGSTILEFGPAMGRMTKYLKEQLNCDVYIIEMDKEGYESSINYAVDGYFGNAEGNEWIDKFRDIKFDYIIFADVIEHLVNPEEVILKSRKLLKHNGKIIFSVPNAAHNSVIIDLINNKFNYNKVGLLDNTHIRFFTYYTLKAMLNKCNLVVCNEKATYADLNETEFNNNYDMVSKELSERLKSKDFGDVYQFIFTCINKEDYLSDKENIVIEKNIKKISPIETFKLYFNDGNGLNENNIIEKYIYMGKNQIELDIKNFVIKDEIRLDFTEESCILRLDNLYVDDSNYNISDLRGNYSFKTDNYYLFLNNDPFVYLDKIPQNYNFIKIEFSIAKLFMNNLTEEYIYKLKDTILDIEIMKKELLTRNEEISNLKNKEKQYNDKINNLNLNIETLELKYEQKKEKVNKLNMKLEKLNSNIIIRQIMKLLK